MWYHRPGGRLWAGRQVQPKWRERVWFDGVLAPQPFEGLSRVEFDEPLALGGPGFELVPCGCRGVFFLWMALVWDWAPRSPPAGNATSPSGRPGS